MNTFDKVIGEILNKLNLENLAQYQLVAFFAKK